MTHSGEYGQEGVVAVDKTNEGNLYIRMPVAGKTGTPVKAYRITQIPTAGRKAYRGKPIKYVATDEGPLTGTIPFDSKSEVKIFNLLEANATGAEFVFLIVGDEVECWKQNGVLVCEEIPRGYI
jgi:hypothetical protein